VFLGYHPILPEPSVPISFRSKFLVIAVAFSCGIQLNAQSQNVVGSADFDWSNGMPLKPTREIKFTTDEGTWISLDISPDGRTIVFDLLGDIYIMPVEGGNARAITRGLAYDERPKFTTDGRAIVFTSDRTGEHELWYMSADGSGMRRLLPSEMRGFMVAPQLRKNNDSSRVAARSRDGKLEVMTSRTGRWDVKCGDTAVFTIKDLTTGSSRSLASAGIECGSRLVPWSAFTPDNRAFVTSFGGKIWRIDVQSGSKTIIPFSADVDLRIGPKIPIPPFKISDSTHTVKQIRHPRPSPDGKRLAFAALGRIWVAELPATTSAVQTITNAKRLTRSHEAESWPAWSPDGKWIAYGAWTDSAGGTGHIYRTRADGTGSPELLTKEPGIYDRVNYSPDGKRILAVVRSDRGLRQRPEFVNNGENVVAGGELIWIPADGGFAVNVANNPPFGETNTDAISMGQMLYSFPHFSSDTGRIVRHEPWRWFLYQDRPTKRVDGLVSMDWLGGNRKTIARFDVPTDPEWTETFHIKRIVNEVLLSPTGDHALVMLNKNRLFLAQIPSSSGGEPPLLKILDFGSDNPRRITPLESGATFAGWKRDGKGFYYAFGSSYFEYDLDEAQRALTDSANRVARGEAVAGPVYSPRRTDIVITVPNNRPTGVIALTGARLITMKGDEVIEKGDIVIRNNRIAAIGRSGSVAIPRGARVVDVTGKTIIPGFIDLHDHILINGIDRTQIWSYLANLAHGVTVARDPQQLADAQFMYEDLLGAEWMVGPRYFNTGPGVVTPSGDSIGNLDMARAVLRRYRDGYKVLTFKEYISGDRNVRQWLIMAAAELGMVPVSHAQGGIQHYLYYIMDGYPEVDHDIGEAPLYKDVIELFARSGTVLSNSNGRYFRPYYAAHLDSAEWKKLQTFATPAGFEEIRYNHLKAGTGKVEPWTFKGSQTMHQVARAGGKIGAAQHGEIPGLGTQLEMWAYADGGMSPLEALRTGTINGAAVTRLADELGSLEVGKLADLQVLDRNPLENIRNTNSLRFVMKNGRLYDASTLAELWPARKSLDKPWWWK
jgi:WD40 repeat protein